MRSRRSARQSPLELLHLPGNGSHLNLTDMSPGQMLL